MVSSKRIKKHDKPAASSHRHLKDKSDTKSAESPHRTRSHKGDDEDEEATRRGHRTPVESKEAVKRRRHSADRSIHAGKRRRPPDGDEKRQGARSRANSDDSDYEAPSSPGAKHKFQKYKTKKKHHRNSYEGPQYDVVPPLKNKKMQVKSLCCTKTVIWTLYICATLIVAFGLVQLILFLLVLSVWPMGFADDLSMRAKIHIGVTAYIGVVLQPVVTFTWLLLAITCGAKDPNTNAYNKDFFILRGYFWYSPILLVVPLVAMILDVVFLGNLDEPALDKIMFKHLNKYEAESDSKGFWDSTQSYFSCCGVDKEGYNNWFNRKKVQEDMPSWKVPESCCKDKIVSTVKEACVNGTTEAIWPKGCLDMVFKLYRLHELISIGARVGILFFSILSALLCTVYYTQLRRAAGEPDFKFQYCYCGKGSCCDKKEKSEKKKAAQRAAERQHQDSEIPASLLH